MLNSAQTPLTYVGIVNPNKPSTLPNTPSHITLHVTEVQTYQHVLLSMYLPQASEGNSSNVTTTEKPSRLILSQVPFTKTDQEQLRCQVCLHSHVPLTNTCIA